jgi:hypothetical protein
MMTYKTLSSQPQSFLALTGLTNAEFGKLLPTFQGAYARAHPMDRTATGQPRQRGPGAGRHSALWDDADKLLFVLVYLKTYPLQVVLGKLFGISTSQANYWLHHLLPIVRSALDDLGVLPERDGDPLSGPPAEPGRSGLVIIDGTERRRQRPKKAEKQAMHYSGKKKAHTDKNVLVVSGSSERVLFLSGTYAGKAHDKRIADEAHLRYPPGTTLYKDAGFQGYEPPVEQTCQSKKKATGARADEGRETRQPQTRTDSRSGRARHRRGETQPDCQGRVSEQEARVVRHVHGDRLRPS